MKPETAAWVAKAEADYVSARREFRARKDPNYDSACFHAQQCGEKYLKAVLVDSSIPFAKIHSLTALLHLLLPIEPVWELLKPDAAQLTVHAVEFCYPGKTADKSLARQALVQCGRIRDAVRLRLGAEERRRQTRRSHLKSASRSAKSKRKYS
ncbi:MAG: HEPN domain-containing protein [Phycisphaerales bacterium]|nr:HEPN domain-containing protein [Phycisphaerales bacterium]